MIGCGRVQGGVDEDEGGNCVVGGWRVGKGCEMKEEDE